MALRGDLGESLEVPGQWIRRRSMSVYIFWIRLGFSDGMWKRQGSVRTADGGTEFTDGF